MMTHTFKLLSTVTSAAFFAGLAVHAVDYTWVGGDAAWTATDAWSFNGGTEFFTATETISSGDTFTIDTGNVTTSSNLVATQGALTVSGGSLLINGNFNMSSSKDGIFFTMLNDASVTMSQLALATGNPNKPAGTSEVEFGGGVLTLTNLNPITGTTFPNRFVNITAEAGEFSILQSDASDASKWLSTKVGSDLFSIDGSNPLNGTDLGRITVTATGADVGALNTELATVVKNGKYLQIIEDGTGGDYTQTLVVVPESGTYALLAGLSGLACVALRRRL